MNRICLRNYLSIRTFDKWILCVVISWGMFVVQQQNQSFVDSVHPRAFSLASETRANITGQRIDGTVAPVRYLTPSWDWNRWLYGFYCSNLTEYRDYHHFDIASGRRTRDLLWIVLPARVTSERQRNSFPFNTKWCSAISVAKGETSPKCWSATPTWTPAVLRHVPLRQWLRMLRGCLHIHDKRDSVSPIGEHWTVEFVRSVHPSH